jgi:hypothetical protein
MTTQIACALEYFHTYYGPRPPLLRLSLTPDALMSDKLVQVAALRVCACEDALETFNANREAFTHRRRRASLP